MKNEQLSGWFSNLGSNAVMFENVFKTVVWALVGLSAMFAILSLSYVLFQKINPNTDAAKRTELNTKIRTILISLALIFIVFSVVGTVYEISGKLTGLEEAVGITENSTDTIAPNNMLRAVRITLS